LLCSSRLTRLDIYRSEKCLEQKLQREMKHVLCPLQFVP
jgi:hypothetical protein